MDGCVDGYYGIMENHSSAQMPAGRLVRILLLPMMLLIYLVCREYLVVQCKI